MNDAQTLKNSNRVCEHLASVSFAPRAGENNREEEYEKLVLVMAEKNFSADCADCPGENPILENSNTDTNNAPLVQEAIRQPSARLDFSLE